MNCKKIGIRVGLPEANSLTTKPYDARAACMLLILMLFPAASSAQTEVFEYNATLEHDDVYEVCPYDLIAAECSNSYMENDALSNAPSATLKNAVKGWMGKLPGTLRLSEISIPGTHDSGAEAPELVGVATQTWNIKEQLQGGIRYFDIRVRENEGSTGWDIYHGSVDLELTFDQVLTWMKDFLALPENSGEVIICWIQTAEPGVNPNYGTIRNSYISNNAQIYFPTPALTNAPSLSEIRQGGKRIYLLDDVRGDHVDLQMDRQKYWKVYLEAIDCYGPDCNSVFAGDEYASLVGKQRVVLEYIDKADASTKWTLNDISGAQGATPSYVASFTNARAFEHLNKKSSKTNVGTIVMDYPGEGLIYRIIKTNFDFTRRVDLNIEIDCYDPGESDTGTDDDITVRFYNGTELMGTKTQDPGCGFAGDSYFHIEAVVPAMPQLLTHVAISTNGSDAFAMDELYLNRTLYAQDPFDPSDGWDDGLADQELYQWGRDGGAAWCLSTDSDDDFGSFAPHCYTGIRFEYTSGKAYRINDSSALTNAIAEYERLGTSPHLQGYSINNGMNTPPTASAGGPYMVNEGAHIALDGSGSSDAEQDNSTLDYYWDLDDDGVFETPGISPTFSAVAYDGPGTRTVRLRVIDDETLTDTGEATITISNVAPSVTANGATIDENGDATISGLITDPGVFDTFTVVIDWGEGTPVTYSYEAGTTAYSESHQYLDDDPGGTAADIYAISITVTDDDGGTATADTEVWVDNVVPTAAIDAVTDEAGNVVGEDIDIALVFLDLDMSVSFADVGTLDSHTVTMDWDDGTVTGGAATSPLSDTHAYADTGNYTIVVTVIDDDTGTVEVSYNVEVVDAVGAVANAIEKLIDFVYDSTEDPAAVALVEDALEELDGNNGGQAANGALDKLESGNWNAALVKISKAIELLNAADSLTLHSQDNSLHGQQRGLSIAGRFTDPGGDRGTEVRGRARKGKVKRARERAVTQRGGEFDLSIAVSQLVLSAKSAVVDLVGRAKEDAWSRNDWRKIAGAEALIAEGDRLFAAGDAIAAVEEYRTALSSLH